MIESTNCGQITNLENELNPNPYPNCSYSDPNPCRATTNIQLNSSRGKKKNVLLAGVGVAVGAVGIWVGVQLVLEVGDLPPGAFDHLVIVVGSLVVEVLLAGWVAWRSGAHGGGARGQ